MGKNLLIIAQAVGSKIVSATGAIWLQFPRCNTFAVSFGAALRFDCSLIFFINSVKEAPAYLRTSDSNIDEH